MNIITLPLGPLETNCYVVFENAPGACALVDPGAQAQSISATSMRQIADTCFMGSLLSPASCRVANKRPRVKNEMNAHRARS